MGEPKGYLVVPIGFRADGTLRTLELTDSDELKVALTTATGSDLLTELQAKLETADLEIVTSIPSVGPHGWISGAWQRQPIEVGYSGRIKEYWTEIAVGAGTIEATSTPVPPGEIHYINFISLVHDDPIARNIVVYAISGGAGYPIANFTGLASGVISLVSQPFVLAPTDYVDVIGFSFSDEAELKCWLWGRRIDIDQ